MPSIHIENGKLIINGVAKSTAMSFAFSLGTFIRLDNTRYREADSTLEANIRSLNNKQFNDTEIENVEAKIRKLAKDHGLTPNVTFDSGHSYKLSGSKITAVTGAPLGKSKRKN